VAKPDRIEALRRRVRRIVDPAQYWRYHFLATHSLTEKERAAYKTIVSHMVRPSIEEDPLHVWKDYFEEYPHLRASPAAIALEEQMEAMLSTLPPELDRDQAMPCDTPYIGAPVIIPPGAASASEPLPLPLPTHEHIAAGKSEFQNLIAKPKWVKAESSSGQSGGGFGEDSGLAPIDF
jgi:hypothetical protein